MGSRDFYIVCPEIESSSFCRAQINSPHSPRSPAESGLVSKPVFTVTRLLKIAKSDYYALSYLSVRPSVRMEQLGSHLMDFHDIWYLKIFRKSVQKV